jgi:hypothetical protein
MARCAACGETILFGGVTQGDLRYCNAICQNKGRVIAAAAQVPEGDAKSLAHQIHQGPCPRCKGPGPVDVHTSYWAWSALLMTRWGNQPQLKCRRCGVKSQLGNVAFTGLLGWWGFPGGLIWTPVQIGRNLRGMVAPPDPSQPSAKLMQIAYLQLASRRS